MSVRSPVIRKSRPKRLSGVREGNQIGQIITMRIATRTKQGLDVDLKPFTPYNNSYSKRKGSRVVNLSGTGAMLSSIKYRVSGNSITIYTDNDKAYRHNEGIGVPKREFMGVDRSVLAKIDAKVMDAYKPTL